MSTLTIRNFEPGVKERLRVRAAKHGRSMAAEARHIIEDAVGGAPTSRGQDTEKQTGSVLVEAIRRRFAPFGGVDDLDVPPRESVREPPDFNAWPDFGE